MTQEFLSVSVGHLIRYRVQYQGEGSYVSYEQMEQRKSVCKRTHKADTYTEILAESPYSPQDRKRKREIETLP